MSNGTRRRSKGGGGGGEGSGREEERKIFPVASVQAIEQARDETINQSLDKAMLGWLNVQSAPSVTFVSLDLEAQAAAGWLSKRGKKENRSLFTKGFIEDEFGRERALKWSLSDM